MRDNNVIQKAINTLKKLHKENAELKRENKELVKAIDKYGNKYTKYKLILQEIKKIAEMDICSNCITQKREDNCQCLADTILQLITKAESEG